MPIDRSQDALDAQQEEDNLLAGQPAATDSAIADTTGKVNASRATSNQTIADVARETIGKYGAPANAAGGVAPGIERGNEDLTSSNENALAARRLQERQANVSRTFNSVFSQMVQATGNKELAAKTAMQYALDQDKRAFESQQNQKKRDITMQNENEMDQFAQQKIAIKRKSASDARQNGFFNSMISTLFGMGGQIGTSYLLKGAGSAKSPGANQISAGQGSAGEDMA